MSQSRRWPAPITGAEKVQLAALIVILLAGAGVGIFVPSQIITPVPAPWRIAMTLAGCLLGLWLGRILSRVNRDYHDSPTNWMGTLVVTVLGGVVFHMLAWSLANHVYFRGGGTRTVATYPVIRLTEGKRHSGHWALIDPFDVGGTIIPIPDAQYTALVRRCGNPDSDCSAAHLCITLPIERAASGAIRVMVPEAAAADGDRLIARCDA